MTTAVRLYMHNGQHRSDFEIAGALLADLLAQGLTAYVFLPMPRKVEAFRLYVRNDAALRDLADAIEVGRDAAPEGGYDVLVVIGYARTPRPQNFKQVLWIMDVGAEQATYGDGVFDPWRAAWYGAEDGAFDVALFGTTSAADMWGRVG
jgi:hypothetical protein